MNERRSFKVPFVIVGSLILAGTGVWTIFAPNVIGYADWTFGRWNDVVCGIVVVVLAIASLVVGPRSVRGFWGTLRSAAPSMAIAGMGIYMWAVGFAVYYKHIGRVDTFFNFLVAASWILIGFAVAATVLALEERPTTPEGEGAIRHVYLASVK